MSVLVFLYNSLNYNFTFYLNYILCLNYWESNFLLALVFVIVLRPLTLLPKLSFVFFTLLAKLTTYTKLYLTVVIKKKLIYALWVGTIIIHPLIFYIFLITVFVTFYQLRSESVNNLCVRVTTVTFTLFFTLCLGGLWGLQSLTWGYVWVSDGIEWLLLTLCLYTVVYYHQKIRQVRVLNYFITLLYILNFLIFIRLNVITTRHSFLTNYNTAYIIILYIFIIWVIFVCDSQTHSENFRVDTSKLILVLGLTTIMLYASLLVVIKYLFYTSLLFYLLKFQRYVFSKKSMLHFLILLFLTVWSTYYSFFHLNFLNNYSYVLDLPNFYRKIVIWGHILQNPLQSNFLLESIVFTLGDTLKSLNFFKINLVFSTVFNNYSTILVCVLFFLKRFEFRLLHKKKTCI